MDRDNKNKLKLLRLLELLRQETDEHHPMTTEKICQRLSENGIGCERRTPFSQRNTRSPQILPSF